VRLAMENLAVQSVSSTDATCNGSATGTASVSVSGGITPYSYEWSDGQTTATATGLVAGTYSVTVIDALNNIVSASVDILEDEALVVTMPEDQEIYKGYDEHSVILTPSNVSGGDGTYNYSWSTGETTESISVNPDETTEYTLTVTDGEGCSTEGTVQVKVTDVSCGNGRFIKKVKICFNGKSLCIAKAAVPIFLRRGATLGDCGGGDDQPVVIESIKAYPNPTRGRTTLRINSTDNVKAELYVYNLFGYPVFHEQIHLKDGIYEQPLDLSRFFTGIYIVKIKGNNFETDPVKILKY
ncbi:MAG: T9SS type A sorting domain-containing protein, partial [Gillisia sp.]